MFAGNYVIKGVKSKAEYFVVLSSYVQMRMQEKKNGPLPSEQDNGFRYNVVKL